MARKSIGEFIAALRKTNGFTQKQLAEKLNVSDKAVSRWERDESAPDISLLPVIAEVLNVTCDELLRGERIISNDTAFVKNTNSRGEKQLEHLLQKTKTRFLIQSIIVIGIAFIGLISALFLDYINIVPDLSIYVGFCLLLIAFICQIIFMIHAFSKLNTKELIQERVQETKKYLFRISKITFVVLIIVFSQILPFFRWMGYHRIRWFVLSLLCCNIIITIINYIVLKSKTIIFSEREESYLRKCFNLSIRNTICILLIFSITLIAQTTYYQKTSNLDFMNGKVFTDINEFEFFMNEVTYMYENVPLDMQHEEDYKEYHANLLKGKIITPDGTVISDFSNNNKKVFALKIAWENDKPIITAYAIDELKDMYDKQNRIGELWSKSYLVEFILIEIVYLIKYLHTRKFYY